MGKVNQTVPLEPDQIAAWEDDGGNCDCPAGYCAIHPEIVPEHPVWERFTDFCRNLVSPIH